MNALSTVFDGESCGLIAIDEALVCFTYHGKPTL